MSQIEKNTIRLYNRTRKLFKRKYICYAPFTSLRFNFDAMVQPCCHTINYNLGNFNTDTILDIWNGKKLSDLRNSVCNAQLNLGCTDCKNQIINKNFYAVEARKYDSLTQHHKYPVFFDIKTSHKCNLSCIMCKPENSNRILPQCNTPAENFNHQKFIKELDVFIPHLKLMHFCGGEPFIEDCYFEIWNKIINQNPALRIDVTSNITVLNEKIISLLENGNFYVYPSIDSFEKKTYEKIRINADFEMVMHNFYYLLDYHKKRNKTFHLNVCPITENWKEIPDIVHFCNKNNIYLKLHNVDFPSHLSLHKQSVNMMMEILNFYKSSLNNKKTRHNKADENNTKNFEALIKRIETQIQIKITKQETYNKEEILDNIKDYILNDLSSYTHQEKEILIQNINKKHEEFFNIIENNYNQNMKDILKYISGLDFSEIIFALETKDLKKIINDIIFEIKN